VKHEETEQWKGKMGCANDKQDDRRKDTHMKRPSRYPSVAHRAYALTAIVLFVLTLAPRGNGASEEIKQAVLEYPGKAPGHTECSLAEGRALLMNEVLRGEWKLDNGKIASLTLENRQTGQSLNISGGHLPRVVLADGRSLALADLQPSDPVRVSTKGVTASFKDPGSGLGMTWTVNLADGANAVIQSLRLTAERETAVKEIVFLDAKLEGARQVGNVDGSVIVCGDIFMAIEHPLAKNTADAQGQVRCTLPRGNDLKAGHSWTYTSVLGVAPASQLRRGFLCYLERRRAHPYRPFLHYNNWYNVELWKPVERTNEAECLETIEHFGRELVRKRGVTLDAFVWDDGWDDHHSLWGFHKGFPNGFKKLKRAAGQYGAGQGVWMSPWGGYASAKARRIAFGSTQGYETNSCGFAMAGPLYGKAFEKVCLQMLREQGVSFFKFDGMGGGILASGAEAELADDIDAVLGLTVTLRRQTPDVFISATVGTWPSPFWTLYADSIWRQGDDSGKFGKGDTRQQWITYRDKLCYERIVRAGPLYPLNALMLGGILVGNRPGRAPAGFVLDEKSLADEIWSFFGSGACLQELYIDPAILTSAMWDTLAAAAKWSRANADVLVDTHWLGGDPGKAEVYGWAAWAPRKGIVVLRNPDDQPKAFALDVGKAFELSAGAANTFQLKSLRTADAAQPVIRAEAGKPLTLTLKPFEAIVLETQP
jgi:hypothetical protein